MNRSYLYALILVLILPIVMNAMEQPCRIEHSHYSDTEDNTLESDSPYELLSDTTYDESLHEASEDVVHQYLKDNFDKNVQLESCIEHDLALIKDEQHKTAIAVFEIPDQKEHYHLTEQEKKHAKSMFEVYKVENKGRHKVISFRYKDREVLPQNKKQALYLLYSPYVKNAERNAELQKYLLPKENPLNVEQQKALCGGVISERNGGVQKLHTRLQQLKTFAGSHYEGFLDSTIVNTDKGHCKIGELKVGDTIACYDINNNKQMYSTVTYVDKRQLPNHIQITIDNQTLQVASQHKFYAKASNEWVTAQQLKDVPELRKLVDFTIQDIQKVDQPLEVVRITVDGNHNFYVTNNNILVHNFPPIAIGISLGVAWGAGAGASISWAILHPTLVATASAAGYWLYSKLKPDRERTQPKFELQSQGQNNTVHSDQSFDAKKKNNPKEVKPDNQQPKPGSAGTPQPPKDPNKKDSEQRNNDKNEKEDAQAPGKPTEKDGFVPPKNWDGKKIKNPNGPGFGWPDKKGNFWIPTGPKGHGGPHWDVQIPKGGYKNIVPGGRIRGKK